MALGTKLKPIRLHFPFRGLHANWAFGNQPPFTSPKLQNVRPYGTQENRSRGGQRPGWKKAYASQLGGGQPIVFLAEVTRVRV